ncbi:MAG: substrate-binding domain-containing protein [Clostridiales bacterium]|nr:substrate-binding domain-containing protein [Clostridiales bacterium]
MKRKYRGTRYFYIIAYIAMIMVTVIVTAGFLRVYLRNDTGASGKEFYDKYYVLITDDRDSSFWQSVYKGASDYGLARNIYVENFGSDLSSDCTKEDLMRMAIAANVDGIILNADESEEMLGLIDEAMNASIPVVTVNSDCTSSRRISYIGVGNNDLGKEYSKQILETAATLITEDTPRVRVAVVANTVPSSGQSIIYASIQETIENSKEYGRRISLEMVMVDEKNTFSVEESIRDLFIADDLPDIIVCLNELDTTCVYQAVIDYNKVGLVHILGCYDSDTVLQGIDREIIDSTIKIDTKEMGEYSVEALISYDKIGFANAYYTVDVILINSTNIKEYLVTEDTNGEA